MWLPENLKFKITCTACLTFLLDSAELDLCTCVWEGDGFLVAQEFMMS